MKDNDRRNNIFHEYSSNLNMLIAKGLLHNISPKYDITYICPLCLNHFCKDDLNQQRPIHLNLEHVPPEAIKGKPVILACSNCNSRAGSDIDVHLINKLLEIENSQQIPGSKFHAFFEKDGIRISGEVEVFEDGILKAYVPNKTNNPNNIDAYNESIKEISDLPTVNLKPRSRKEIDHWRLQVALLKISYELVFARFGYLFILDDAYDEIRRQIRNPDEKIYTEKFWDIVEWPEDSCDSYFVLTKGVESIMSIFLLKTDKIGFVLSAFTPLPIQNDPIQKILDLQRESSSITIEFLKPKDGYLHNVMLNKELYKYLKFLKSQDEKGN